MIDITKEMCVAFFKGYYKIKIVLYSFLSVFIVAVLWGFTRNFFIIIAAGILLVALFIILGINIKNKIYNTDFKGLYLEEDIVINFKKRIKARSPGVVWKYIYYFKKYGKHIVFLNSAPAVELSLHSNPGLSSLSVDRLSAESCNKGDIFYLLIWEKNGKKKIVQSFYKYYFDVHREDFEYVDGKYLINLGK